MKSSFAAGYATTPNTSSEEPSQTPSVAEYHAVCQALERTEEDLALVLGVLAAMWPSSLTPVAGGTHHRVVVDSPAGEIAFTVRSSAAKRMWHIPETSDREPDTDAARMRDQRLLLLASGLAPRGARPLGTSPPEHLRVTARRSGAVRQATEGTGEPR